ncbi:MAG: transglycosylase domain-containing protein [Anaerolineae bacterium]|nr:transglycosylase domain-containing protein [Anaerolineae bacterium]
MRRLRQFWRQRSRTHKALLSLGLLLAAGALWFYVWVLADLPSLDRLEAGLILPGTRIYDRHGALLYEIIPPEQGRNRALRFEDIPLACRQATLATEDANYYQHPGVDVVGILRALWINLQGGDIIAGGSTITQQTVRLLLLSPAQQTDRSLQRKLKEAVLALQLNGRGKDEVLALYLNQAYFGNLAYGLEAAARTYFHRSAPELSTAQCALLAGLLQNASLYDPLSRPEAARDRQQVVLRLMVQNGYLTETEARAAAQDDLQFGAAPFPIAAPHFVMAVWKQLERQFPDQLYGGGLDVVTTLDLTWQNEAQRIVRQQLDYLNHPPQGSRVPANARNAAVLAMDPFTGQILIMLGSPDYFDESIDGAVNATLALRQPGSALKPFVYALAMQPDGPDPYTAATMILDVQTPFVTRRLESYSPANYALVEHGPVLLREALASSYNIPAVVALEHTGLARFVEFMGNLGLESLVANTRVDLSIILGGGEVRLLDLTRAYAIFPNGGYLVEPSFLLKVTDAQGRILYEHTPPRLERRVLDERIAYLITSILSDNNARLSSFGAASPLEIGRPAAAKTGTTQDFRDNWVMGYTPNLVLGVWVGNASGAPMIDVTGVSGAGPIYNMLLRRVLLGQPELDFAIPPGLITVDVCELSGLLPTPQCPLTRREYFIAGTQPTEYDTFYQVFAIDRETGFLATDDTPLERRVRQTFIVLPQEAQDWARRHGLRPPPHSAPVQPPDAAAGLRLLAPDPYTIYEISAVLPPHTQRLRFHAGAPPGTVRVTYWLNEQPVGSATAAPWEVWWPLAEGQYTLVAVADLADGTQLTTDPLPFQVVPPLGPEERLREQQGP